MGESVTVVHYDPAGIQHRVVITGPLVMCTVDGTNATVRVSERSGKPLRTCSYSGVASTIWESKEGT